MMRNTLVIEIKQLSSIGATNMAGLFKNIMKSLTTKVIPDIAKNAFPTVQQLNEERRQNFREAEGVMDELGVKMNSFKENFAGLGTIHRNLAKQLGSGSFGTSQEDADNAMMKSMFGIDFDEPIGGADDSADGAKGSKKVIINNINSSKMPSGITEDGLGTIQSIAKQTNVNARGLASNAKILSSINYNLGLMNAFHIEKTSAYYDLSLESMKGLMAGQKEMMDQNRAMADHYKEMQENARLDAMNRQLDVKQVLNPANFMKRIAENPLFSDLVMGAAGSKVKQAIQDPLGMAASLAGTAIMQKFAGGLINSVEQFAKDLPYMAQNKFEKWSGSRDFSKSGFSLTNVLATIGDNLKLNTADARVRMNQDKDGPVAWDAKARRALVTEIPGYLAKMLRELEATNHLMADAWGTKRRNVEHQVYDGMTGSFTYEGEIKKRLNKNIKDIDQGQHFGGLGSQVDTVARMGNMSKSEAAKVKAIMMNIGNSNMAGEVNLRSKENVKANMANYVKQTYKRKEGQTDENYNKAIERRIAALTTGKSGKSIDKFIGTLQSSGTGGNAIRQQTLDRLLGELNGTSDASKKQELQEEYTRQKDMFDEAKKRGRNELEKTESALKRHSLDRFTAAERFGNSQRDSASSSVFAINNMSGQMSKRQMIAQRTKMPDASALDKLDAWAERLKEPFDKLNAFFSKWYGKFEVKMNQAMDWVGDKVKKAWGWMSDKATKGYNKAKDGLKNLNEMFQANIVLPLKKRLMGGDEDKAKKLSFMKVMEINWNKNVLLPFKRMLLGDDKDAAKKLSLWQTIKFSANKAMQPVKDWFNKQFVPSMKDMYKEVSGEVKKYALQFKDWIVKDVFGGGKAFFKGIFGDENIAKLRKNLVDPFKNAVNKLTDSLGGMLKFFARIPVNFFRGVADTIKMKRWKKGEGNFSEEEIERFKGHEERGSAFDWKNKGNPAKKAQDATAGVRSEATEMGANINEGLADGMQQTQDQVQEQVDEVAHTSILDRIKKALGIHSPSREMIAIGGHIMDGLRIGMENGRDDLRNTMRGIHEDIIDVDAREVFPMAGGGDRKANAGGSGNRASGTGPSNILESIKRSVEAIEKTTDNNLPIIADNTKTIIDILNGLDHSGGNGGKKGGLFGKIKGFFTNIMTAPMKVLKDTFNSLKDLPGKLLTGISGFAKDFFGKAGKVITGLVETVTPMIGNLMEGAANVLKSTTEMLMTGAKRVFDQIGPMAEKLGKMVQDVATKALETATSLAKSIGKALKPMTDAAIQIGKDLLTGMRPAISALTATLSNAIVGLAKFGKSLFDLTMNIANKLLAKGAGLADKLMGGIGGLSIGGFGNGGSATVAVSNFSDMRGHRRSNPLFVHVVDGRVQTYSGKGKARVGKIDNDEGSFGLKGLLGGKKDKKDGEGDSDSLMGAAGGALAGTAGAALLGRGKALVGKGMSKIGGFLGFKGKAPAVPAGAAAGAESATVKAAAGTATKVPTAAGEMAETAAKGEASAAAKTASKVPTSGAAAGAESATVKAASGAAGAAENVAAGAAKSGGVMSKIGSAGKGLMKGGVGKLVKGVGAGAIVSMGGSALTNLFTEEGSKTNKLLNAVFGTVGDAATGAAIGSFIPVIGNVVGAVGGALYGAATKLIPAIEDAFSEEIQSMTTSFLEFPDKLTAWIDALPAKVDKFAEDIPKKLLSLFEAPDAGDLDPVTGLPKEEKPSILWKMTKALGNAGVALIAAMPKLGITLAESFGKILGSALMGAVGMLGKGVTSVVFGVSNYFEDMVAGVKNWAASTKIGSMLGLKGESKDEENNRKVSRAASQNAYMANYDATVSDLSSKAGKLGGQIGGAVGAVAMAPVTGAAVLAKGAQALTDDGGAEKNRNRYDEAMKASGGDEKKAKEYAKTKFGGDVESYWNKGKDASGQANKAVSDARYQKWLIANNEKSGPESRARFDAMVASEAGGKAKGNFGSKEVSDAIAQASAAYGLDVSLMTKMALVESGMDPKATSPTGAKGLFQFVTGTGKEMGLNSEDQFFNPYTNAMAGARYLKMNGNQLAAKNVPVNPLTLYLAHQLGAGGVTEVWNAAANGKLLSDDRIKAMTLNNPGLTKEQLSNPKLYISAWDKKLQTGINPFGDLSSAMSAVKVDSRVAAIGAAGITPTSSSTPATATADSKVPAVAASSPMVAAATATPSVSGGNAINGASPSVMAAGGSAQVAANETVAQNRNTGSVMAAAVSTGVSTDKDPILSEMQKQTGILASIAGNTGEMKIAALSAVQNNIAESSSDKAEDKMVAAKAQIAGKRAERLATDLFGNMNQNSGSSAVPSGNALRIASGMSGRFA